MCAKIMDIHEQVRAIFEKLKPSETSNQAGATLLTVDNIKIKHSSLTLKTLEQQHLVNVQRFSFFYWCYDRYDPSMTFSHTNMTFLHNVHSQIKILIGNTAADAVNTNSYCHCRVLH